MSSRATRQLAQLWQLPLLLLSLLLFATSGYLFINASPGLTVRRRIDIARLYMEHERPEAALQQLNRLMVGERLNQENEASVHLLMGKALEEAQRERKISIPANHSRIIEQTQLALRMGAKPSGEICRRLGDSFVALGRNSDGIAQFKQAMALDPERALWLKKKIIEVQTSQQDQAAAMASLDDYLANKDLTDAEKAWGMGEKSQILADRGDFVGARTLIADSLKLDNDPLVQAEANYRLAYCAWKLNKLDEAKKLALLARDQFRGAHPLDADAAYLLAQVDYEQNDLNGALGFYEIVIAKYPESRCVLSARLGKANCHIHSGRETEGIAELRELVNVALAQGGSSAFCDQLKKTLRQTSDLLTGKMNDELALEALELEHSLAGEGAVDPDLLSRLASAAVRRADQVATNAAESTGPERVRQDQLVRDLLNRAGDAQLAVARATLAMAPFWAALDLYKRSGNSAAATNAMEVFVQERASAPEAADVLVKLGEAYSAAGATEQAINAYKRVADDFAGSPAAARVALPLARAYIATGTAGFPSAERILTAFIDRTAADKTRAPDVRAAMLELGSLYYRTDQYDKCAKDLEALLALSPAVDMTADATFLAADSYRKSALGVEAKVASSSVTAGSAELSAAVASRKEMLTRARKLYDSLLDLYHTSHLSRDIDKQHERQSYFYRGDCAYELADFDEAIRLYDAAAKRYEQEPAVLAAYVQIVNSYCAMGKMDQARIANEKAKALLRNLPAEAFNNGSFTMPKSYWEQWLKWTSNAGAF